MTRIVLDVDDNRWKVTHLARIMRTAESEFLSELAAQVDIQVTDARPLIVLGLDDPLRFAGLLESFSKGGNTSFNLVAKQIRDQTKPPRIEEPGWGGVVSATRVTTPGFLPDDAPQHWLHSEYDWRSTTGQPAEWDDLINPTLIRAGVES